MRTLSWISIGLALLASPAAADTLELLNGDLVSGEVLERTHDAIVLEHEVFGVLEIPATHLKPEGPPEPEPEHPGLFGTRFMEGWTREINLGLDGSEGDSVNLNLRSGFRLRLENDERRWVIRGTHVYESGDGDTTDNFATVMTRHTWLFQDTRWFAFAKTVYDFDEFKTWRHRLTTTAGPGYDLVKRENLILSTSVGPSFLREFEGQKDSQFSGFWGIELRWQLNSMLSMEFENSFFPHIDPNPGDFRNVTTYDWKVKLLDAPDLSLNLGVENEYDSAAAGDDHENDLTYYTSIGLEF